jgi:hypothetical protein
MAVRRPRPDREWIFSAVITGAGGIGLLTVGLLSFWTSILGGTLRVVAVLSGLGAIAWALQAFNDVRHGRPPAVREDETD